jgi:hypothetical protein
MFIDTETNSARRRHKKKIVRLKAIFALNLGFLQRTRMPQKIMVNSRTIIANLPAIESIEPFTV